MKIIKLALTNFRNYHEAEITPYDGVNLLYGKNGSGKTNVLEAIHLCTIGRSFRDNSDDTLVRQFTNSARIFCQVVGSNGAQRTIGFSIRSGYNHRKGVLIDGKSTKAMTELLGVMQCVLFSPDDLSLVYGGPLLRRKFLDAMLCQVSVTYLTALSEYNKEMEERNQLLRQIREEGRLEPDEDQERQLDVLEAMLARAGQLIANRRSVAVRDMSRVAGEKYKKISDSDESFTMEYVTCHLAVSSVESDMLRRLKENRKRDIVRGTTSVGIHRDEVLLNLSSHGSGPKPMKQFASQGQCRTAALCLRLAQVSFIKQRAGENPILLLDDVMSELDVVRREKLLGELSGIQSFITCTDLRDVDGYGNSPLISTMQTYMVAATGDDGAARIMPMSVKKRQEAKRTGVFELDREL